MCVVFASFSFVLLSSPLNEVLQRIANKQLYLQNLFKCSVMYTEVCFLYGQGKSKNFIADRLNYFIDGGDVIEVVQGTPPQPNRTVTSPFTLQVFKRLVDDVSGAATEEETVRRSAIGAKSGPCAAILPLLITMYNTFSPPLVPEGGDIDDNDDRWKVVVRALPGVVDTEIMRSVASKSATSLFGANGPAVIYAYACLALGMSADSIVPGFLLKLPSATELGVWKGKAVNALLLQEDGTVEQRLVSDRAIRLLLSTMERNETALRKRRIAEALNVENANAADQQLTYAREVSLSCIDRLGEHILHVAATGLMLADDDITKYGEVTIKHVISTVFPRMYGELLKSSILPTRLRSIAAHLAEKAADIVLRHEAYVQTTKYVNGIPVLKPVDFTPPWNITTGTFAVFTVNSIVNELSSMGIRASRRHDIAEMLKIVLSSYNHVKTSQREEQSSGSTSSSGTMFRLQTYPRYVVDHLRSTNAAKKANAGYHAPGIRPFQPVQSPVASCHKKFPESERFTPGIFTVCCTCSKAKCIHASFMDTHESVNTPFEFFMNRFPNRMPQYLVYDNACHFLMYAVSQHSTRYKPYILNQNAKYNSASNLNASVKYYINACHIIIISICDTHNHDHDHEEF